MKDLPYSVATNMNLMGSCVCVSVFVSVSLTHTLIQLLTHNNVHQHVLAMMPHMLFFMLSTLVGLVDALL